MRDQKKEGGGSQEISSDFLKEIKQRGRRGGSSILLSPELERSRTLNAWIFSPRCSEERSPPLPHHVSSKGGEFSAWCSKQVPGRRGLSFMATNFAN